MKNTITPESAEEIKEILSFTDLKHDQRVMVERKISLMTGGDLFFPVLFSSEDVIEKLSAECKEQREEIDSLKKELKQNNELVARMEMEKMQAINL